MLEKRKERRIKVNLAIEIVYYDNLKAAGNTENISRLGAYVEADKEIPVGTDLDITLEIPVYVKDLSLTGAVKCRGNIFRSTFIRESESKKYYGIGIFFTSFYSQFDKDKLSRYIDFLVLKENNDIKKDLMRLRNRRSANKGVKPVHIKQSKQEVFQREAIGLLNQIINRLEEMTCLLKSQNKIK